MAAWKTIFQQPVAYLNFVLDGDLRCCYKQKKWFRWATVKTKTKAQKGLKKQVYWTEPEKNI